MAELHDVVNSWLALDKDPKSRAVIEQLRKDGNEEELRKRMIPRIAFGTAGLRGPMKSGFACMNDIIIQQTSQGLCQAMLAEIPDVKTKGVVVGYDGRYNSQHWGRLTAAVFISKDIPVYLYRKLVPTPFVPFGVEHYKAAGGVMVTASHNPKDDNGYKVYWENGCQIKEPVDKIIAGHIDRTQQLWDIPDTTKVGEHPLCKDPTTDCPEAYYKAITPLCHHRKDNEGSSAKIVYTAMHGVGTPWVKKSFEVFGLPPFIPVKEQCDPDPEFSTVTFPNPEEGKGALKLAIETADREGSSLILANDPDADRLAVAEKQSSGEWKIFNGNEIGVLLAHWAWTKHKQNTPNLDPSKCAMINSAVSSKMMAAIATKEGFKYEETLTGFKYMGNKAADYIKDGYTFLFAYEESIGFMFGDVCLDKDGVRAASVFAEMSNSLARQGKTCTEHLDELYDLYGFYAMKISYFFCYDKKVMHGIFDHIEEVVKTGTIGSYEIAHTRDLRKGTDTRQADGKATLPVSPASPMYTIFFKNGCVATLRGSGTEPKLKYYVELPGTGARPAIWKELDNIIQTIIDTLLEPTKNGLVKPSG